jgi:hypothetical protein
MASAASAMPSFRPSAIPSATAQAMFSGIEPFDPTKVPYRLTISRALSKSLFWRCSGIVASMRDVPSRR